MKHKLSPAESLNSRGVLRYKESLRQVARIIREKETKAESVIWEKLLRRKKIGYKFTRQKPIGRFIVDFYCSELLLVIEIDGSSHKNKKNLDIDRDKYLSWRGIETLRFNNEEVLNNLESVKDFLTKKIKEREKFVYNVPPLSRGC